MEILSPVLKMLRDKYKYNFKDELYRTALTVIYDIGKNKILKVTHEKDEAIAASIIKKYNLKNVVKVYRVFITKNKHHEKYYIEEERLEKLGHNENFEIMYEYFIDKVNYNTKYDIDFFDNESKKILKGYNDEEKNFIGFSSKDWMDKDLEFAKFDLKFKFFRKQFNDLVNGLKELNKIGIDFYDIHFKNIMKKGNTYKFVDIPWHNGGENFEVLGENQNPRAFISENQIKYAITNKQKSQGLKNIEPEDWNGMMVFKNVKAGDVFVGDDCLFDIRIAFLNSSNKVLSIGIIKKGSGRVVAPKNTSKAIETAASDDYQIIKGEIYNIPAKKPSFSNLTIN